MFKLIGLCLAVTGLFSVAQAQNDIPSSKYSMTCYANAKKISGTKVFTSNSLSPNKTMSATVTGDLTFVAYVREKNKVNPVTPFIKMGEPEVVINVFYKGYALSDTWGKNNAVSTTRLNGDTMNVGCVAKKN